MNPKQNSALSPKFNINVTLSHTHTLLTHIWTQAKVTAVTATTSHRYRLILWWNVRRVLWYKKIHTAQAYNLSHHRAHGESCVHCPEGIQLSLSLGVILLQTPGSSMQLVCTNGAHHLFILLTEVRAGNYVVLNEKKPWDKNASEAHKDSSPEPWAFSSPSAMYFTFEKSIQMEGCRLFTLTDIPETEEMS